MHMGAILKRKTHKKAIVIPYHLSKNVEQYRDVVDILP